MLMVFGSTLTLPTFVFFFLLFFRLCLGVTFKLRVKVSNSSKFIGNKEDIAFAFS